MNKIASKSLPVSDIAKSENEKIKYKREGNFPKKTPVDFYLGDIKDHLMRYLQTKIM
jgi:hypothetical protein